MDVTYPVGRGYDVSGPLSRFLPPMEAGAIEEVLSHLPEDDRLIVDPFGSSPQLAVEAASGRRRLVVACNNPVTRFVLQAALSPVPLSALQAALAHLAGAPKNGGRLEPFLLDLYQTTCNHCGAALSAEYFIWDRERNQPVIKGYACQKCNFAGESEVDEADVERAAMHARRGLPHAQALEQVAPSGDPDRPHAEAALAVYPGRALYALMSVVNKLDQLQLDPETQRAVQALLLSALDSSNALWGYPEGRHRPKQLSASPQYKEVNVWRAMERAVDDWSNERLGVNVIGWDPEHPPQPGQVALFPGSSRELSATLEGAPIGAILTVVPRPNQAYWTLSALWAAWLWGREAAQPIKATLRRRRYDWNWHASALATVMESIAGHLNPGTRLLAMVPEAEPGFASAILSAMDQADFEYLGAAWRNDLGRAFMRWIYSPTIDRERAETLMEPAMVETLRAMGEPAVYAQLHLAAVSALAQRRALRTIWEETQEPPVSWLGERVDRILVESKAFLRFGGGVEPETGRYWLSNDRGVEKASIDRLEDLILELLRRQSQWGWQDLDRQACLALTGILTPERRSVAAVLSSYAILDESSGTYQLRAEDWELAREQDIDEIRQLLSEIGQRLGFKIQQGEYLHWIPPQAEGQYVFSVQETASFQAVLDQDEDQPVTLVLPGGRANLVNYKARRDERVTHLLSQGDRILKFRHIRRLASEDTLTLESLPQRLSIDPVAQNDPQLPLL